MLSLVNINIFYAILTDKEIYFLSAQTLKLIHGNYKDYQKLKNIKMQKLATLANNIQKQNRLISNTIVGVVTDVTRPLYREK